jgi:hypothetical protein
MNLKALIKRLFKRKPIVGYVSEVDKFLAKFDAEHPKKSASQLQEIKKYQRIFQLRDNPTPKEEKGKIWQDF